MGVHESEGKAHLLYEHVWQFRLLVEHAQPGSGGFS